VSNAIVRSALFAAVQSVDREIFHKVLIASQDGIEIIFSGEQFNQDDHDLFMQLVYLANHKALGELVRVPASVILAGLGRGRGGREQERLKKDMHRLVDGTVNLKAYGINYIGHLLDDAFQDENEPQESRYWHYRLNPKLATLFSKSQFSFIDWEQRKKLKKKELAKFIQLYILSHSAPFPVSVAFLHKISGSQTKELRKFRQNLKIALEDVKEIGVIFSWRIDEKDLVYVERLPNVVQLKHCSESPEQTTPDKPVFVNDGNAYLKTTTIEKFRELHPRSNPYDCKMDFDAWLHGKPCPQSYDAAFLGFAKKWVKGKI
jgi:hypothetical protein